MLLASPVGHVSAAAQRTANEAEQPGGLLVYHQLTNLAGGTGYVGSPVLSADGSTAVFTDAPGSGDPAIPNRILVVDAAGGEPVEVDAYQTLCYCGSIVDISDDGGTAVSTEGLQLRIAGRPAGSGRELLRAAEITAVRIAGDGQTVFFLIRRDTATVDGTPLPRGVWAIDADGDNLRQVVGASEVAEAVGVPLEETGCCFHADGVPLDVSADGGRVVFGAYAGTGEHVLAVDGAGGEPVVLVSPAAWVKGVAISADGGTIAYIILLPDNSTDEAGVVNAGGGEPRPLVTGRSFGFREPPSLNADGTQLLVAPYGLLIDVESGATRQLAAITPGADAHVSVLIEGLPRATMDDEGARVLYAMRTTRCADCANPHEQLAILDLDPADLGDAPDITEATIDPDEIPLNYQAAATISAEIETGGTVVTAGVVALRDGLRDINVADGTVLYDDGAHGDERANDGVFTNAEIVHAPYVAREDDSGPRLIRVQVEIETADGLRHATALDAGTLTVVPD